MQYTFTTAEIPKLTPSILDKIPYHKGTYTPKIVFVAEAPGKDEENHILKWPFVGASGTLFHDMCNAKNINMDECYITNLLKERPPYDKFKIWQKDNPQQYETYVKLLAAELSYVCKNANIIVPVGAKSLEAICGKNGIENWRGSIIKATMPGIEGKKCVPIIHPASILR